MARTPILLAFLCLIETANRGEQPLPVRRFAVYRRVLRLLLQAGWHDMPGAFDDEELDARLELLTFVAYEVVCHEEEWRDLFEVSELSAAIQRWPGLATLAPVEPGKRMFWELGERDGILVCAGVVGRQRQPREQWKTVLTYGSKPRSYTRLRTRSGAWAERRCVRCWKATMLRRLTN
jgi:hypothetical protein